MPFHLQMLLPGLLLALGYGLGDIDEAGLLTGALYVGWVLSEERLPSWLWWFGALASSVALAIHVAPGFSPHVLGGPLQYSPDAGPVWLRLSWDKALVGVTLLAWWLGKAVPYDTRRMLQVRPCVLIAVGTLAVVPALALGMRLVALQPKWPALFWTWFSLNLGVAVLAEELLFRALLQRGLIDRFGFWAGLLVTAVLFGVAHWPFSAGFALVAAVAALGYGAIFERSGRRLSMAVALHLAVNVLHVLLLSYPLRLS
ncbi:CPBP family intramembrane metalloprotease [Pseudomonas sp. LTJR-52]|uniref:CPBP family intramembrane glutamic endopeptidase n=1 Tax=Pseudomonas sp. LTJR-52 TaxID=2479392 RepID=UPI000EFBB739|nr:CPBP family intramembrane glutamic endopeptidase [Pseudomonas sp. LTJR-52]AYN93561.1 CPBP family intramembrane metalloprotease [Pseudomonas sp. LTJR-52]